MEGRRVGVVECYCRLRLLTRCYMTDGTLLQRATDAHYQGTKLGDRGLLGVDHHSVVIRRAEGPGWAVTAEDGSLGEEIAPFVPAGVLRVIKAVFGNIFMRHQIHDPAGGVIGPGLGGVVGGYRAVRPFHVKTGGGGRAGNNLQGRVGQSSGGSQETKEDNAQLFQNAAPSALVQMYILTPIQANSKGHGRVKFPGI
jgi:hypothetical protein